MYTAFYKLNERPFELTPDLRFLYLSRQHREALAHLTYGIAERKVFVQLTGEVGTGKTLMLDALIHGLDATTKVARVVNTTISRVDLIRALAWELGADATGRTKMEILKSVSDCLSEWAAAGRNAVFFVDEAQNLEPALLEEVRLLSNMTTLGRSSLQIVLAGQPELRAKLENPELRQLRQRIGIRYHLEPLSVDETGEYVRHRLHVAGAKDDRIFDASAIEAIFEYSKGIPRTINILCDNALLAGYADGKMWIGKRTVRETAEALETREPIHALRPARDAGQEQSPGRP